MKQWIISVSDHTYVGDRKYVTNAIKTGRESMKGKFAVIGLEKKNVVILVSEPHRDQDELDKAILEYEKQGFKVYTSK